jgi:hypothetical protein
VLFYFFYVSVVSRISQSVDVFCFAKVAPIPTTDSITSVELSSVFSGRLWKMECSRYSPGMGYNLN